MVASIAAYVILAFAVLDAYYLALERKYRLLDRHAAEESDGSWVMDVDQSSVREIMTALRSPVIPIRYGSSLAVASAVGTYLLFKQGR